MGKIKTNQPITKKVLRAKLRAFTLVETIVAVVVLLSVSGILMYLLLQLGTEGFSMRTHQMEGRLRLLMEKAKTDTLLSSQQIEDEDYVLGQSSQNGQSAIVVGNNTTNHTNNLQLWRFYIQDRRDSTKTITHYLWLNPKVQNQP